MSWGVYYKHQGYLSHMSKCQLHSELDTCNSILDTTMNELLALAAMTPPQYAKDCEGAEYPWHEYIAGKMKEYRETLEEYISLKTRISECLEVMEEHPEDVEEG